MDLLRYTATAETDVDPNRPTQPFVVIRSATGHPVCQFLADDFERLLPSCSAALAKARQLEREDAARS